MNDFSYSLSVSNNIIIVHLKGDLADVFSQEEELKSKINLEIEKGILNCIIDLSEANYISSNGIGCLIVLLTKLRNKGGELILLQPSEHIKKLLLITKLNGIFDVFEEKSNAIKFFK